MQLTHQSIKVASKTVKLVTQKAFNQASEVRTKVGIPELPLPFEPAVTVT
jgi:hypothetical protein